MDHISSIEQLLAQNQIDAAKTQLAELAASGIDENHKLYIEGLIHLHQQAYSDAKALFTKLYAAKPDFAAVRLKLASSHHGLGEFDPAIKLYQEHLAIVTDSVTAITGLSSIYITLRQYEEAQPYTQLANELAPDNPNVIFNDAIVEHYCGDYTIAKDKLLALIQSATIKDEYIRVLFTLAKEMQDYDTRIELADYVCNNPSPSIAALSTLEFLVENALFEQIAQILPHAVVYAKNRPQALRLARPMPLIFMSRPEANANFIKEIHQAAAREISHHRQPAYTEYDSKQEPLRVAIISPDLREHSCGRLIKGFFEYHDPSKLEIYCYSCSDQEDDYTHWFIEHSKKFVNVFGLSAQAVAELIHQDRIAILMDLAGHTKDSRMDVLALKPTPVALSYLGYPYTTGLPQVDYYVTDRFMAGPQNHEHFAEKLLPLPGCFVTMLPPASLPDKQTSPFEKNDYVTLGTLNNPYKFSDWLMGLWAEVLLNTDDTKLHFYHPAYRLQQTIDSISQAFERRGVNPDRLSFINQNPSDGHFGLYDEIDISLDTYPVTGGTTTMDCSWMSVPLITLAGPLSFHRVSYCILKNLDINLDDLIARSPKEFVSKAVELINNKQRLKELHQQLHLATKSSVISNPKQHTLQFQELLLSLTSK